MSRTPAVLLAICCCLAPLGVAPVGAVLGGDAADSGLGGDAADSGAQHAAAADRVAYGIAAEGDRSAARGDRVRSRDGNGAQERAGEGDAAPADHPHVERVRAVEAQENTTEYLAIPTDEMDRDGFEDGSLDVAAAVGRNAGTVRTEFRGSTLDQRIRNADGPEERRAVLRETADVVDRRVTALEERERQAVAEYSSGERSGTELLRTQAAVDAEARALADLIRSLHFYHRDTADSPLTDRELATYRSRLEPLNGPVRQRIGEATAGGEPVRVFVETREGDVTLATLDRRGLAMQYIREAHLRQARDVEGESQLDFDTALERIQELYPRAYENAVHQGLNTWVVGSQPYLYHADVYAVGMAQPHGFGTTQDLTTYVDGSTTDAFLEVQYRNPGAVPTSSARTTSDGLTLVVNTTRGGGPMSVDVVDANTGDRVSAAVEANGERVGRTGSGGELWTIAPHGDVAVNATAEDGREVRLETTLS